MNKYYALFVLLAFAMFALILPAAAQTELPAIDEAAAADLLGRWYMNQVCDANDDCMSMADYGVTLIYELNADNTITVSTEDEALSTLQWYMENGTAHSIVPITDTQNEINELYISEDGSLVSLSTDSYVIFTREEPVVVYSEQVAADAEAADFAGEWHIKGIIYDGQLYPSDKIGTDTVLTIGGENFVLADGYTEQASDYIFEEGKLFGVIEGTDDQGQPWDEFITIELHDDGNLYFYFDQGTEYELIMEFTREKNVYSGSDVMEAVGTEISDDVSGLLDGLTSGEGDFDFGGLVEKLTGSEGLDVSGLMQKLTGSEEFDVNGLIQKVTGSEDLDFGSLMSGLTGSDEGGGFDLSGLMDGLMSGNAEGGFNIGGLLDMFGSGN